MVILGSFHLCCSRQLLLPSESCSPRPLIRVGTRILTTSLSTASITSTPHSSRSFRFTTRSFSFFEQHAFDNTVTRSTSEEDSILIRNRRGSSWFDGILNQCLERNNETAVATRQLTGEGFCGKTRCRKKGRPFPCCCLYPVLCIQNCIPSVTLGSRNDTRSMRKVFESTI